MRGYMFAGCLIIGLLGAARGYADPNCAGRGRWPSNMAFAELKNSGVFESNSVDSSLTESTLIASQRLKGNKFKQVFLVRFHLTNGGKLVSAIVVSYATNDECSIAKPDVYQVINTGK